MYCPVDADSDMIIFDLEFYVPKEDRIENPKHLVFSPMKPTHLILGGTFRLFRHTGKIEADTEYIDHELWIWDFPDEKTLLQQIYDVMFVHENLDNKNKAIIGLGIITSDIMALQVKWDMMGIATCGEVFERFKNMIVYDLGIALSSLRRFSYPSVLGHSAACKLMGVSTTKKPSGTEVWTMYDQRNYNAIKKRNRKEVQQLFEIFAILNDRVRKLPKKNKYENGSS